MANTIELREITGAVEHATRELTRIADALERMSPPYTVKSAPAAPLGIQQDPDEPNVANVGF